VIFIAAYSACHKRSHERHMSQYRSSQMFTTALMKSTKLSLTLSYILVPTVLYYISLLNKASVFRVSESS
jgi:hypothetical protein